MPFTKAETQSLLAQKGIGKTVLQRLQQMGLDDTAKLAAADADDILQQGAALTGSTCWKTARRPEPPSTRLSLGQKAGADKVSDGLLCSIAGYRQQLWRTPNADAAQSTAAQHTRVYRVPYQQANRQPPRKAEMRRYCQR